MKNIKSLILIAASTSLLFASCAKEINEYKPAPTPTTVEAYFPDPSPASYALDVEKSSFAVKINRINADKEIEVAIQATAPEEFNAPIGVKFNAGEKTADYVISYDPSKIEEGKDYKFTLTICSELSEYAEKAYSFKAALPLAEIWEPIKTQACFRESIMSIYTGEPANVFDCYVEKLKDKEVYRIVNPMSVKKVGSKKYANPYYDETGSADGIWPEEFLDQNDYYLEFDLEGERYKAVVASGALGKDAPEMPENGVFIAEQGLHFAWKYGEFTVMSPLYLTAAFRANYGITDEDCFGVYDKDKKSITMGECVLYGAGDGSIFGWPSYAGTSQPILYLDKSLMVDDYNDDTWLGKSSALYEGSVSSLALSSDGVTPTLFDQSMRYDATYLDKCEEDETTGEIVVPEGTTTTYYLPDYFTSGYCVAFTAPAFELLENGSKITDMGNEQKAGINIFGNDIYFKVKKGTVSFADGNEFPVFNITLTIYAKDADGNVTTKYGSFEEKFIAFEYGKDGYSLEDIVPCKKDYFYGDWAMTTLDLGDGSEYTYLVSVTDGGEDESGSYVKFENLSGYGNYFDDSFLAEYDGYYGLLFVYPGLTGASYNNIPISLVSVDPDAGKIYSEASVIAGVCQDENLAFVSMYSDANISGIGWRAGDGGLAYVSNIRGYWYGPGETSLRNGIKTFDAPRFSPSVCGKKGTKLSGSILKGARKVSAQIPYKLESNSVRKSVAPCFKGGSFDTLDKNAPKNTIKAF